MNIKLGTPAYMAPELWRGVGYDSSVDVWALGVTTYFLLSGAMPWHDKDREELVRKIQNVAVPIGRERAWDNISAAAKDFVKKMLQKEPRNRMSLSEALAHPWIQNRSDLHHDDCTAGCELIHRPEIVESIQALNVTSVTSGTSPSRR